MNLKTSKFSAEDLVLKIKITKMIDRYDLMGHYVLHIRGWVILNANVPMDMNSTSEVG